MRRISPRLVLASLCFLASLTLQGCRGEEFWSAALGISISPLDFGLVRDGEYTGAFESGVGVKARVRVADHRVTAVEILEHRTQLGKRAESLGPAIIRRQSLDVDVVSGATMSSLVMLKAVEQALIQGLP